MKPRRLTNDEKWGRPFQETETVEGYPYTRHLREKLGCEHSGCAQWATWLNQDGRKVCKTHVGSVVAPPGDPMDYAVEELPA